MLDKIRTVFSRTPTTIKTYTPEDLHRIGQALNADRVHLAEIRRMPVQDLDQIYREATDQ